MIHQKKKNTTRVALRKESVDRNPLVVTAFPGSVESLSARRAWIEIHALPLNNIADGVALRKESVDRNVLLVNGGALSN